MMRPLLASVAILCCFVAPATLHAQWELLWPTNTLFGLSDVAMRSPVLGMGWMIGDSSLNLKLDTPGGINQIPVQSSSSIPLKGLWLTLAERLSIAPDVELTLEGWYLIPSRNEEVVQKYFYPGAVPSTFDRRWDVATSWWFIDASLSYVYSESLVGLVGVRGDFLDISLTNPPLDPTRPWLSNPLNQADLTLRNVLPYVGFQTGYGNTYGNATARVIGFPWTASHAISRETSGLGHRFQVEAWLKDTYFVDFLLEYKTRPFGDTEFAIFGNCRWLYGRSNANLDRLSGLPFPLDAGSYPAESILRQASYILGAKMSLAFASPF